MDKEQFEAFIKRVEETLETPFDLDVLQEPEGTSTLHGPAGHLGRPVRQGLVLPGKEGYLQLLSLPAISRLEEKLTSSLAGSTPSGVPFERQSRVTLPPDRDWEYKEGQIHRYEVCLHDTGVLYRSLAAGQLVHYDTIRNMVEEFSHTLVNDRNILLNLAQAAGSEQLTDYLYRHALNVCLLCLNIAMASGYSKKQVVELGAAALLADIGMMLVPAGIRLKRGRLSADEQYEIRKHPMMGSHLLEKLRSVPDHIILACYQHHERESGEGYPKGRRGRLIHNYAKTIGIADVYEAVSSRRLHRVAAVPYQAMELILRHTGKGLLDPDKVRNFIRYMSLFPVGSLVRLNSGRVGKVVAANEHAYTRPVVSVIADPQLVLLPEGQVSLLDLAGQSADAIKEPLRSDSLEHHIMFGF